MTSDIRIAVIGAGYMATEHVKAFCSVPGAHVCGVYSRTRSRAEEMAAKYRIIHVCDSIDELYQNTRADLVVIAVSELAVREICFSAFEFPWQCLIEKPVGYNIPEAESIIAAAKSSERQAYVALNRRHYSSTRAVKENADMFAAKRLVHVYDQENPQVALEAGWPRSVVENWRYANSIHLVDYFQVLCRGELLSVEKIVEWDPSAPSFAVAKLTYASGDIGIYEAVWEGPGPWAVTVTTHDRRWELRPLEQAQFQDYKSRKFEPMVLHEWDAAYKPGLRQQAEEAVRAVRGEPHASPRLGEGLKAMKIVREIYGC